MLKWHVKLLLLTDVSGGERPLSGAGSIFQWVWRLRNVCRGTGNCFPRSFTALDRTLGFLCPSGNLAYMKIFHFYLFSGNHSECVGFQEGRWALAWDPDSKCDPPTPTECARCHSQN